MREGGKEGGRECGTEGGKKEDKHTITPKNQQSWSYHREPSADLALSCGINVVCWGPAFKRRSKVCAAHEESAVSV